jgi:hypothetical protein
MQVANTLMQLIVQGRDTFYSFELDTKLPTKSVHLNSSNL